MASGASGTELSACTVSGVAVDQQGKPVGGAIVRLRPKYFLAADSTTVPLMLRGKKTIADTVTNALGEFQFELVDTGEFSIEVNYNDSLAKLFPCTILTTDTLKKMQKDTLVPMSIVWGHFDAFDSNNVPDSSARIQIYGLDRFAKPNPDSAGKFSLKVPNGNLNLKFSMDTGHQNEMDVRISLLPNQKREIGSFRLGQSQMRPPPPCQGFNCDSIVVRAMLDSLKLDTLAVDSIAKTRNSRIVELDLHGLNLTNIPGELQRLDALEVLDLSNNRLCKVAPALAAWADTYSPGWRASQKCP
jgi:hypothetical protein